MTKKILEGYVHQFPAPAVLIGCGTVEEPNLITCAWFGTVNSEPPMVYVSIRPERFSYPLVKKTGEFTVNIPSVKQLEMVKHCGTYSGRDHNKFEKLGITAEKCEPLKHAPQIKEFDLVLACEVKETLDLGTHTMFTGLIKAIHAEEGICRPTGRVNPFATEQVVYLDGRYWTLTRAE